MTTLAKPEDVPAHVPTELVFDNPMTGMEPIFENVFETRVTPEHASRPPVYWCRQMYPDGTGAWVVRRVADLQKVYADDQTFTKKGFSSFSKAIGEDWDLIPAELTGEEHTEVRRALNVTWHPTRILALKEKVRLRSQQLIAAFKDKGHCDFVAEFAVPFPVSIFLDAFGLPQEKIGDFLAWNRMLFGFHDPEGRAKMIRDVRSYLMGEINARRTNPKEDLLTEMLTYDYNGEPWSDDMLFGYALNLFVGGLDTVAMTLGQHVHHLATHLDDQAELRADRSKINLAVEELLRAYATVTTFRTVTVPTEFGGVKMMPGDKVAMSTMLTGRDPEAWENPDEIRFDRKPRHLTFGGASHRCLGIHLARQEIQIAIDEMLNLPEFRTAEPVPFTRMGIRSLPLVW